MNFKIYKVDHSLAACLAYQRSLILTLLKGVGCVLCFYTGYSKFKIRDKIGV